MIRRENDMFPTVQIANFGPWLIVGKQKLPMLLKLRYNLLCKRWQCFFGIHYAYLAVKMFET